jgi:hypothetical protein
MERVRLRVRRMKGIRKSLIECIQFRPCNVTLTSIRSNRLTKGRSSNETWTFRMGLDSVLSFFVCDGQRLENFSKHSTAHRGVLRCDTFTSNMGREGNGGKGREGMTKLG